MKKLLVWDSTVYDMKNGRRFGGIAVQLNLWIKTFAANGWDVHALSTVEAITDNAGIHYHKVRHVRYIDVVYDWIVMRHVIREVRPDLVMIRGAQRLLFPLSIVAHHYGAKVIMFGASNVNFVPGTANVRNPLNRKLYEWSLRWHIDYFVTQNQYQAATLKSNYGKDSLTLLNIWDTESPDTAGHNEKKYDVIWVSNFRRLKRAEWIIEAAKELPQYRFAIIGGPNDKAYYDEIASAANDFSNIDFLGIKTLCETTRIISQSRILACTSEYEGFPNTFLQAWAAQVPVVSTVDPSGIVMANNLGNIVTTLQEFIDCLNKLLLSKSTLRLMGESITQFFHKNISCETAYHKLISYVNAYQKDMEWHF